MKIRIRPAFTLAELMFTVAAMGVLVLAAAPLLAEDGPAAGKRHGLAESGRLASCQKALIVWAASNNDRYPTPSVADRRDNTVAGLDDPGLKNTTGAVFSMLVFGAIVEPDALISPVERGPYRSIGKAYEYDRPSGAAVPVRAAWDPRFAGAPKEDVPRGSGAPDEAEPAERVGRVSYAHTPLNGPRRVLWRNTFSSATPVLANRGPMYQADPDSPGAWRLVQDDAVRGAGSAALPMHGEGAAWAGYVAFADGRVERHDGPAKLALKSPPSPPDRLDHLFVNEPEFERNAYLRQLWRGVPMSVDWAESKPLREGDGPHVYIDGDALEPPAPVAAPDE